MIFYIAGKMTGLKDYGRKNFYEAEKRLREIGHTVLNPACLPIGLKPESYMPIGLAMLNEAEAIYMLKDWEDSKGARLELRYAVYQNKKVFFEADPLIEADKNTGIKTLLYDISSRYENCTVEVLENSISGDMSFGWWRNE